MIIIKPTSTCPSSESNITSHTMGGYCSLCKKNVYDLTQLSTKSVEKILRKHSENFCAKLTAEQINTFYNNTPVAKKSGTMLSYKQYHLSKTAVLATSLFLNSLAYSQDVQPIFHDSPDLLKKTRTSTILLKGSTNQLNGTDKVSLFTANKVYTTTVDAEGKFTLEVDPKALKLKNLFALHSVFNTEFFIVNEKELKHMSFKGKANHNDELNPYGSVELIQPTDKSLILLDGDVILDNKIFRKSYNLYNTRYKAYYIPKDYLNIFTKRETYSDLYLVFTQ